MAIGRRWAIGLLLVPAVVLLAGTSDGEETVSGALLSSQRFLDSWSGAKSANTSLVPTREDVWSVEGSAAEAYATALVAAGIIDPLRLDGLLRETLRDELTLTSRLLSLPDDYNIARRRFANRQTDPHRIARNSVRYAVSLLGIARIRGPNAWSDRAAGIVDDLYTLASVEAPASRDGSSPLPSDRLNVNGPLLYLLPQLHALTGDSTFLHRARRLADVYVADILPLNSGLPPARWDFESHRAKDAMFPLDESGALFLLGLTTLHGMESELDPSQPPTVDTPSLGTHRSRYSEALLSIFESVLSTRIEQHAFAQALTQDGRGGVEPQGGTSSTSSAHGAEILLAAARFSRASGNLDLSRRIRPIAGALMAAEGDHIPSVPGISSLQAFLAPDSGFRASRLPSLPVAQNPSDLAGAAADARNSLAAAWHRSAGTRLEPWDDAVDIRARVTADTLRLEIRSEADWEGRLQFDLLSPLDVIGLPARFALDPDRTYTLRIAPGATATWPGRILADGIAVHVDSGTVNTLRIWPVAPQDMVGETDSPALQTGPDLSP